MEIELKCALGEVKKATDKNNQLVYITNFLIDGDEKLTLWLNEQQFKPYSNLKHFDPCKVSCRLYKSEKGKFNLAAI